MASLTTNSMMCESSPSKSDEVDRNVGHNSEHNLESNAEQTYGQNEALRSLENLMNEFFHDSTTNDRKRQIEQILDSFAKQSDCWQLCVSYLRETNNEYAKMYCLSVLESVVNARWHSFGAEKSALRLSIWKYLLTNHQLVPHFVSNKCAKIIVNMARIDWPHFYPDFMQNILDLLQSRATMSLGLTLIQTTIEELTIARDDVCASRKCELNKLIILEIPRILVILTNIMELILDKHINFLTATPPPSPSQSPNSDHNESYSKGDILSNAFELSLRRGQLQTIPDMDAESLQISLQILKCLTQLFEFIPVSQYYHISNSMLATIFVFASFGCNNSQVISYHKVSSVQLAILAMNCINEIISKSITTSETNEFIYNMFQNTFHLLQKITKNSDSSYITISSPLENLDEEYIGKFTEFLRLFIGGHLPKFEKIPTFPIMEFLGLVFQYTFKQTSCEAFVCALDVWSIFIDYLIIKVKQETNLKQINEILERYKEPIVSLLVHTIRKMQFKFNQRTLDELDNENLDDDHKTEWQNYLCSTIEIVVKIADIYPRETYESINELCQENLVSFFGLELYLENDENNKPIKLNVAAYDACRLHCTLRDLSSALKLVGRLSDHFISENFSRWFASTKAMIEKLIQALIFCNKNHFHKLKDLSLTALVNDFVEVNAQIMATIKAYCHWLHQYCVHDESNSKSESSLLISAIIENCTQIICDNTNYEKVNSHVNTVHSAIHCLYSITSTVRPVFILRMECVQILFTKICASVKCDISTSNGTQPAVIPNMAIEDEKLLCRSISNMLLLPWHSLNDNSQNWQTRTLYHDMFIESIVEPFKTGMKCGQLTTNGISQQSYCRSLSLLSDIVANHRDSPTRSKQLLFKSIQETIDLFTNVFSAYFTNPLLAEHCLHLFTVVFDVLRIQISFQFVEKTTQLMLKLFSTNQMNGQTMVSDSLSSKILAKFLKMLTLIVQQPGALYKSLLPGIISFALDQIYPMTGNDDSTELRIYLYECLFQLLLNNWKYFYPNNAFLDTFNSENNQKDVLKNSEAFVSIMNIFAQSFLQTDITIFKQNLTALETLNLRLRLYQKQVFKETMIKHFLCLFMRTLLDKSLNLLQDDILTAVYHMAATDFDMFFNTFIPQFLCSCDGLTDNQRDALLTKSFNSTETDFPSFVKNMNIFLSDLRYYRSCNKCSLS